MAGTRGPNNPDQDAAPISTQTERVLRDFVRDAVSRLSEALKDSGTRVGG